MTLMPIIKSIKNSFRMCRCILHKIDNIFFPGFLSSQLNSCPVKNKTEAIHVSVYQRVKTQLCKNVLIVSPYTSLQSFPYSSDIQPTPVIQPPYLFRSILNIFLPVSLTYNLQNACNH